MKEINSAEAGKKYGITSSHSQMDNGEYRFRLKKDDGTCYIRTEATQNSGWQNSHYHKSLLETYIVQSGWILYAFLKNGRAEFVRYEAAGLFTTEPHIAHNVFLSAGAVIHTIKHGKQPKDSHSDRYADSKETTLLDKEIEAIKGREAIFPVVSKNETTQVPVSTDEGYRHFDNLIWQVPAWATALFALSFTIFPFDLTNILSGFGLNWPNANLFFYLATAVLFLLFGYTMYRFRYHQKYMKSRSLRKWNYWISPQIYLNLLINFQGGFFIVIAIKMMAFFDARLLPVTYIVLLIGIPLALSFLYEFQLFRIATGRVDEGKLTES